MKVLSNLEFKDSYQVLSVMLDFPVDPKEGAFVLKDNGLYVYMKDIVDGQLSWHTLLDFSRKNLAFVHEQTTESTEWTIQHNMGTRDLLFAVYDENNVKQVESGWEIIDENTIKLTFFESMKGKVLVLGMSSLAAPGNYYTKEQTDDMISSISYITEGKSEFANGTLTLDLSSGNLFKYTITENTTIAFSNVPTGKHAIYSLRLTNGGNFTVTFPAECKWPDGGTLPTFTTDGEDEVSIFYSDDAIRCNYALNFTPSA